MLALVSLAYAGNADLKVTNTLPVDTVVGDVAALSIKVENSGGKDAFSSTLVIDLPKTHNSPTAYIQGQLGTYDSRCTLAAQKLTCVLGTVKKFKSTTVAVNFTPVWANEALSFKSTVSTTSTEVSTTNNSDTDALAVSYIEAEIVGPVAVTNDHCTGTGLVSYWECDLAGPSAIMSHDTDFAADGTLTFPIEPSCEGTWSQSSFDHLEFEYVCDGQVVANFAGDGVGGDCFHGMTTFPNSTWVSPYQVCLP